jgi:hypothetical protein
VRAISPGRIVEPEMWPGAVQQIRDSFRYCRLTLLWVKGDGSCPEDPAGKGTFGLQTTVTGVYRDLFGLLDGRAVIASYRQQVREPQRHLADTRTT